MRAWDAGIDDESRAAPPLSISVSISAKQLADAGFVKGLETTLRETGVAPSRLHLEITEIVAAADAKLTATVLSSLKHLGLGLILDDFGTGNCSLSGLRQFPVDALRIHNSLVSGMLLDRGTRDTTELIVLLARKLKLSVIAEGVESIKQLDHLLALGCELGQGQFFSPPVEAKAVEMLLRQPNRPLNAKVAGAN